MAFLDASASAPHDAPTSLLADELSGPLAALGEALHRELLDAPPGGSAEAVARRLCVERYPLLHAETRGLLVAAVVRRATGLGPLEALLADPTIDEIMVTGTRPVWIERDGRLQRTDAAFPSEGALREAIDRILSPLGRRVDAGMPLCDARLPDGSRVNVAIPPIALDGSALTIRRFRRGGLSLDALVQGGSWEEEAATLLRDAVRAGRTILVCGATGAGKTTVLSALASEIDAAQRIVTIEDAAELALRQPHVVRLEARPSNLEGEGAIPIRALVRNAMRMRPDRLVVGEVRGAEALDLLVALSSGHTGGLSTVHAGSCDEAVRRLEILALMAGEEVPLAAIRELARGSIDLVVHQDRRPDGQRVLAEIAEVRDDGQVHTIYRRGGS